MYMYIKTQGIELQGQQKHHAYTYSGQLYHYSELFTHKKTKIHKCCNKSSTAAII